MAISEFLQVVLRQRPDRSHVKKRNQGGQQVDYLETQYVIDRLNEIFGYDGWNLTIISQQWHDEGTRPKRSGNGENHVVSAEAQVRLEVHFPDGRTVHRDDVGLNDATNPTRYGARMQALKSAVSDGLKRAAKSLGPQFGLALYGELGKPVGVEGSGEHRWFSVKLKRVIGDTNYRRLEKIAGDGLSKLSGRRLADWFSAAEAHKGDNLPVEIDNFLSDYEQEDGAEGEAVA